MKTTEPEQTPDHNQKQTALFKALVSFVEETQDVIADSKNPFHKNTYASLSAHLAEIKPIAAKHGIAILQFPATEEGCVGVRTVVVHINGGSISQFVGVPASKEMTGQNAGALFSYFRRYALASIAGVSTEDDDGESDRAAKIPYPKPDKTVAQAPKSSRAESEPSSIDDLIVPFGKNKGNKLSELDDYNLGWWANTWEPKPWEKTGKVGPKDLALKAGAVKLWSDRQNQTVDDVAGDDVPF